MPDSTRCQRKKEAWLGIVPLSQVGADLTQDLRESLQGGPVRTWGDEPIKMKGPKRHASALERSSIAAPRRNHLEPALLHCPHERNSQMVVLATDVEHTRNHDSALLLSPEVAGS